eukprot:TRINITY_DN2415_c0_g1_i1.p1 TRINITY_DN2415_c0_g1~~TRINITY_DN2415_c0_g1_i1.p1  ORF type:complete len:466 (-),score=100.91 TRINITY_DN2415_c0_g1_i1:182-1579(-)
MRIVARLFVALVFTAAVFAVKKDYSFEANAIIKEALYGSRIHLLEYLCDTFGPRPSGSKALDLASDWLLEQMRLDRLENVHSENCTIPHWERGNEYAVLVRPYERKLVMIGLGHSVGTGPDGVTAEVIEVLSFTDLEDKAKQGLIKGKIVFFNVPFTTYGGTVSTRNSGPAEAAKYGAVAVLIRSITPYSLQTPHTGLTRYQDGVPKIAGAALTLEDADLLSRYLHRGETVVVKLYMEGKFYPDVEGRNIVAEIIGREKPDEVVVMGGHIDSWDNADGALDDAGGVFTAWEGARIMGDLIRAGVIQRPRRTIRVVAWTDEETGARGGFAYRDRYFNVLDKHVLAIECDGGHLSPVGFSFTGSDAAYNILAGISQDYLSSIGGGNMTRGGGGVDIDPIMKQGVPGMGLEDSTSGKASGMDAKYFYYHHTNADNASMIRPAELSKATAMMAVMSYVVADQVEPLPRD